MKAERLVLVIVLIIVILLALALAENTTAQGLHPRGRRARIGGPAWGAGREKTLTPYPIELEWEGTLTPYPIELEWEGTLTPYPPPGR